jgi:hypothetical protein
MAVWSTPPGLIASQDGEIVGSLTCLVEGPCQRRGFHLAELRKDAIAAAREIKPGIPRTGHHGIPIRDELELELLL